MTASAVAGVPNDDSDPGNWTGVEVTQIETGGVGVCVPTDTTPCEVTAPAADWRLYAGPSTLVADCDNAELHGAIYSDGRFEIDGSSVSGGGQCNSFGSPDLPWQGQICAYTATDDDPHQFWYREDFHLSLGTSQWGGASFGELVGGWDYPTGSWLRADPLTATDLVFDHAAIDGWFSYNQSAAYWLQASADMESDSERSCDWPELSS